MNWRWLWALVPTFVGLLIGIWLNLRDATNPIFYVQTDLGSLIFIIGLALSILIGVVLITRDRVERNRINVIIESAEDRRRFLRRLDHELKNPLTAILAGLANLSVTETPDARQDTLVSVQDQVGRLRRLVAELRKLSELETRPLELSPIDMTDLLEDAFALAEDHTEAKERTMSLSIPRAPWPLPTISGDRDLLILAIHNLLDNAIKFTNPDDMVEVRAFEDGANVVIEVADTGPGIPQEEIAHVWEELYRGESARGIPGSGLGLALTRAIVLRHDGDISLRSRPGEGTVFITRLPVIR
jgi:two-component system OmpR family sensor kinase